MKTVLVSGASGIVGYGILRSLRLSAEDIRLVGTTIYQDSVVPAFCDIFELAPPTSQDGYLEWLNSVVSRHSVDLIIPSIECDVYKWNEHREAIESSGVKVLLNNENLIELCHDKWLFYNALKRFAPEFAIPTRIEGSYDSLVEEYSLPFLLKPRCGFASKGIVQVANQAVFDEHKALLGPLLMAQPIVGSCDEEYTVSGFFDKFGELCCSMTLKRKLSSEGFTQSAKVAVLDGATSAMRRLGRAFKAIGPTNFQFRVHRGDLKCLEINPRISSATSIRAAFGYNESLMSIKYFLDQQRPDPPCTRSGRAVRYIEDHVFL
ncbi:MAG: carbamoyl-phosphate synthase subunit L [Bacteroidia bacterium]|nr:carbamoyl-phosphate synthase subunit L [Bacteroidia bacterium]